jgi:hypothetical protein
MDSPGLETPRQKRCCALQVVKSVNAAVDASDHDATTNAALRPFQ